jgi:hypothetical protein
MISVVKDRIRGRQAKYDEGVSGLLADEDTKKELRDADTMTGSPTEGASTSS